MITPMASFGTAIVDENIYILGNNLENENVVQVFDHLAEVWTTLTNMTMPRSRFGAATVNGNIYAIGGRDDQSNGMSTDIVEEYQIYGDFWTLKTCMPTKREGLSVVVVNDKIYAIGGKRVTPSSEIILNTVEEYDPNTDNWTEKAGMPTARYGAGATVLNGKIYVVGGCDEEQQLNCVEVYDPQADTWETKTGMSTARLYPGVIEANGVIYAVGGLDQNTVEKYDADVDKWVERAAMTNVRGAHGVAYVNKKIYAMGGINAGYEDVMDTVETLDLNFEDDSGDKSEWLADISMPNAMCSFGTTVVNGNIYVLGNNLENENVVQVFDHRAEAWTTLTNMTMPRSRFGVATVNGNIYAIGGRDDQSNGMSTDIVEEYQIYGDFWTLKTCMPTKREGLSVVVVNDKIYAIGGKRVTPSSEIILNTVEEYDPNTDNWTEKAGMPTARYGAGATVLNGKIYVVGGCDEEQQLNCVEVYDPQADTWETKTGMSTARLYPGVIEANGVIYAVGGLDQNTVEKYDADVDKWVERAAMTNVRGAHGVAYVNKKIYAMGGINAGYEDVMDSVETLSLGIGDDYGNSFESSTPIELNVEYLGHIDYEGDADFFSFTSTVKGTYIIQSSGLTNVYGSLYDSAQKLLAFNDDMNRDNKNFEIKFSLEAHTKYYIKVRHYSKVSMGLYKIIIDPPVKIEATPLDTTCVLVTWQHIRNAVEYELEVDGVVKYKGTGNRYTHNGLIPDVVHKYRVRTKINGGTLSDWSNRVYATTKGSFSTIKQAIPTSRYYFSTINLNGKIYVIGGLNIDNGKSVYSNTVEAYDPITNKWSTKASMPTARCRFSIASTNGKIYVMGGNNGWSLNTVEEYDPIADKWTTKANMPKARYAFSSVALDGKIYAIGGYSGTSESNIVEEYDPIANKWITKASMPTVRQSLSTASINGKIYPIGGYNNTNRSLNTVEEYDPISDKWIIKEGMLTKRYALASVTLNEKIYAVGGYFSDYAAYSATIEEYDPVNNRWSTKMNMPIPSYFLGVATANGKMYTLGGYNADGPLDVVQEFNDLSLVGKGSYTINTKPGDIFNVIVSETSALSSNRIFTISYDPNQLQVLDLCGATHELETIVGAINGTNITITQYIPGTIVFTLDNSIPFGKTWSGVANVIKFQANVPTATITYEVQ